MSATDPTHRLVTEAALTPALEQVEVVRAEAAAIVPRMEQIETMAGLAPGEVTDAQTANLISQPASSTRAALNAAIDEAVPAGNTAAGVVKSTDAAEFFASRLAFGTGDMTVGIASDSTSNDPADWVRQWASHMAERSPRLRVEVNQWNNTTGAYGAPTIVQEGEGEPAFSGQVIHDTFTRTSGVATPDQGGPWEVTTPAAWTLDGSTVRTTGNARLLVDTGGRDMTSTTTLDMNTTGTGSVQTIQLRHGIEAGAFVQLTIYAGGSIDAFIFRRANGASTEVARTNLTTAIGLPANTSAAGQVTVTIVGSIQNYRVTISRGGQTWTEQFQITEDTYAQMEPKFALHPNTATPGIGITEATVAVADRPATYQTLRIWSGTMGGGTLQYQLDNWDEMFGDEVVVPGTPAGPVTMRDEFARTGVLTGSTATTGETWKGGAGWTLDGTKAVATGAGSSYLTLPAVTKVSANLAVTTATQTAAKSLRLDMRSTGGESPKGLYFSVTVGTGGAFSVTVYVRTTAGGMRTLGTIAGHGVTTGTSAPQTVPVSIALSGLNVTATAGTGVLNATITQAESAELGDQVHLIAVGGGLGGVIDVLDITADYTGSSTAPVYGDPLDVMVIAHGHNYGNRNGAQYLPILEEFLDFMSDHRPSTVPLLSSQNPQFAPSANPAAHADRLRAVREYARDQGITYAPVFEHFARQPDGGKSWVLSDGVHPTVPGYEEWGRVLADVVT